MRTIDFTGYIDEDEFWGDEITPSKFRNLLYGEQGKYADEVTIQMHCYGGSCYAATQMYDAIREYPGAVTVRISGCAASAATVVASAGDIVEMTPGSVYMIHDPSTFAWGNEADLTEAIGLLRATKASIINVYRRKCALTAEQLAEKMTATTWMDAERALKDGFIDRIAGDANAGDEKEGEATDSVARRTVNRADAEAKIKAWFERKKPGSTAAAGARTPPAPTLQPEPEPTPPPADAGSTTELLRKRLALLQQI